MYYMYLLIYFAGLILILLSLLFYIFILGLWFPWLQSKSHNPWTLLQLAHSKEHSVRLLGVKALAADHGWSGSNIPNYF